jgi:AcrR family transcriptional regulator
MLTSTSNRPTALRLLDAAEHLMRTIGLANATTKAIAREAGCSEAALYKHYASKEELFVRVLLERSENAAPLIAALNAEPDQRSLTECLTEITRHAALFYAEAWPLASSLFADPALLRRHRDGLRDLGLGPHHVVEALAARLERERASGRVRRDADAGAAAALLLGACFQRAFFVHFSGGEAVMPLDDFAHAIARTIVNAVS